MGSPSASLWVNSCRVVGVATLGSKDDSLQSYVHQMNSPEGGPMLLGKRGRVNVAQQTAVRSERWSGLGGDSWRVQSTDIGAPWALIGMYPKPRFRAPLGGRSQRADVAGRVRSESRKGRKRKKIGGKHEGVKWKEGWGESAPKL
jgi:hypothetical protein